MPRYRGLLYYQDREGLWTVKRDGEVFVVALDDSKLSGRRAIVLEKNCEKTCLEYIDWLMRDKA